MKRTYILAEFALYTALAFLFSYIESFVPLPLPFPGIKLGLANLVIILSLYQKGFWYGLGLSLLRNILTAITFGNPYAFLYSLAGSLFSLCVMQLTKILGKQHITPISVSACGGCAHTMGQLLVAGLVVGFPSILGYIPILYFGGFVTGILIGIFSKQCLKRLPSHFLRGF